MRLGKEQAAGYIEDTEVDVLQTEELKLTTAQADETAPAPAAEPWLTVS